MADATVKIGADITQLQAGLARSRADVATWGKGVSGTIASSIGGALAAGALTAALGGLVKEFADISDAADRAGVSVRFLLSIKDDAQQTGTRLETAAKSVKKFITELNDPKAGEKMGDVLSALGTDVETLRAADPETLFTVLSKAIAGVGSQADKLAILGVLLGDTGGKFEALLPLLQKVGTEGLKPVSDEMVEATKTAAALDDEFDTIVSTLKSTVLPVFLNFIKVMKLGGALIFASWSATFGSLFEFLKSSKDALGGFYEVFKGALTLDKDMIESGAEKVRVAYAGTLDRIVQNAKDNVGTIELLFNDIGKAAEIETKAVDGTNKALEEKIKLMREAGEIQRDMAKEQKAEEDHAKGMTAWAKGQLDTLQGYQAELDAIQGKDPTEKKKSISDLNEQLKSIMALKAGGGGVIASSATQMGFGGRVANAVSQSAVEQKISETNKLLSERNAEAAKILTLMESIKETLD